MNFKYVIETLQIELYRLIALKKQVEEDSIKVQYTFPVQKEIEGKIAEIREALKKIGTKGDDYGF